MSFSHRKPQIESLEQRQMMAADVDLVDGVLHIEGTSDDDQVTVSQHWGLKWNGARGFSWARRIQVAASQDSAPERESFWADDVNEIQATLGDGDDEFTNNTSKPSKVWGQGDNDTLRGGSNTDVLVGGPGNDNLYGRSGSDELWGEAGLDGLFGGRGRDELHGGSNADRFLLDATSPDDLLDARSIDATIHFRSGDEIIESKLYGREGRYIFEAGAWQDDEIELVDSSLKELHQLTGSDHLLERHDNTSLSFVRQGRVTDRFGETPYQFSTNAAGEIVANRAYVGGTNDDRGRITITDDAFELGDRYLRQTVFHEIGHNFDERHENLYLGTSLIDIFRRRSGWDYQSKGEEVSSWQTESNDGGWAYNSSANFMRDYGRTNPLEDFATTFAAYFMGSDYGFDAADRDAGITDGRSLAPEKFEVLDLMFTTLGA